MWLHDTHPSFCFSLDIQCGHHRLMARVIYMLVWNRKVNCILYFRKVLDTKLCDKVCQRLETGQWFSQVLRFPPPIKLTATI
jgi:hypothetical protein